MTDHLETLLNRLKELGQAMPPNAVSMEIQRALKKYQDSAEIGPLDAEPNCCANGNFDDGHDCEKQPPKPEGSPREFAFAKKCLHFLNAYGYGGTGVYKEMLSELERLKKQAVMKCEVLPETAVPESEWEKLCDKAAILFLKHQDVGISDAEIDEWLGMAENLEKRGLEAAKWKK